MHVGVCQGWPWSPETGNAEWAVPSCLGREEGPPVGPTGDGVGLGVPGGPGPQTTGTPGCGHAAGLSEAPEEPARFKGWEKGNVPLDAAQLLSL